jgi:hypothetical protein
MRYFRADDDVALLVAGDPVSSVDEVVIRHARAHGVRLAGPHVMCRKHPRYTAMRKPRCTRDHPTGCNVCWALWSAKHNEACVALQRLA